MSVLSLHERVLQSIGHSHSPFAATAGVIGHPIPPVQTFDFFTGNGTSETQNGTSGADFFNYSQGGNDTLNGLAGGDTFVMGAAFGALDKIDGGADGDGMILDGDYSAGVTFNSTTLKNVEEVVLTHGHSYKLTLNSATVASSATLAVKGQDLASGDTLLLDGTAIGSLGTLLLTGGHGADTLIGGSGNDTFTGGDGNDILNLTHGGDDTAYGGNNDDLFSLQDTFNRSAGDDFLDGGAGFDTLRLNGDYASATPLALDSSKFANIERIDLAGHHDYEIDIAASAVAAGAHLTIDGTNAAGLFINGSALAATTSLTILGCIAEGGDLWGGAGNDILKANANALFGTFIIGGGGQDQMFGSGRDDQIEFTGDGVEKVQAGGGDDEVIVSGGTFTAADRIDCGSGYDVFDLWVGTTAVMGPATIVSIERLTFQTNSSYDITVNDSMVDAGVRCLIEAFGADSVIFDGSQETDGSFEYEGTSPSDRVKGSAGADIITGNGSRDYLTGNAGADQFNYSNASDSTSVTLDVISGFTVGEDLFHFFLHNPAHIDAAVNGGHLSKGTFDFDMASAVGAGQLAAGDAVVFTASSGSLANNIYLVVDRNGISGYQANQDFVIELKDPVNIAGLTTASFI